MLNSYHDMREQLSVFHGGLYDSEAWTGRESWRVKHWHVLVLADIKMLLGLCGCYGCRRWTGWRSVQFCERHR